MLQNMLNTMIKHRQNLHKIPELDDDLYKTKEYLLENLRTLDCEITPVLNSGLIAYFDKGNDVSICFRTDMDALPMVEANPFEFKSQHQGAMHGCGHDGHMAMALAYANYVNETDLPNNVVIIFQPAEETTGGAKKIVETGVLDKYNVQAVYGIHLWPGLPKGTIATKPGAMMPKSSEITVNVIGKSTHAAKANEGVDALFIATQFLNDVYKMRDEKGKAEKVLLQICKFVSGTSTNVIPGDALMRGTMRVFSMETFNELKKGMEIISRKYETVFECKIKVELSEGYLPVINDEKLYEFISPTLMEQANFVPLEEPVMIAEDFSYYGAAKPAVFAFLGTGKEKPLHSVDFDFDEESLIYGLNYIKALSNLSMASFNMESL